MKKKSDPFQEHKPTKDCWRMPKFQFGEYETDYDYQTGQDLPVIDCK